MVGRGSVGAVDVGIVATHTGGVLHARYGAGVVAVVLEGAAVVLAADGTVGVVLGCGHDDSDGDVVAQGSSIVHACDAAVVHALVIIRLGERGCAGTVGDGAAVVDAHNAAVIIGGGLNGMDKDVGFDVAVGDGAPTIIAHDAANVVEAGDTGVGEGDATNVGVLINLAEEALVAVGYAVAVLVDADATDGVALAVVVPIEVVALVADGGEVTFGVANTLGAVGDVGSLLEVHVLVGRAAVHVGSQLVQVAGTGNQVRVGTGAATVPCPRRRREQHHEQRQRCPHREISECFLFHTFMIVIFYSRMYFD